MQVSIAVLQLSHGSYLLYLTFVVAMVNLLAY